jgi:hypothetical protein
MIREGMITRKKALERLKDDDYLSRQFLEEFLLELGIELQDLCAAMARHRKEPLFRAQARAVD